MAGGWKVVDEGFATSSSSMGNINLRLDWGDVQKTLKAGNTCDADAPSTILQRDNVLRELDLNTLDPTQRAFADRVLAWAAELVLHRRRYLETRVWEALPVLRLWLCGSAGSGKSTTLRMVVQHMRLLFQEGKVDAIVELTAYTGVAAFNIGFGAKTACSSFHIFPKAAWKAELQGEALRKHELQWRDVVLLIVDEISFIGRAFFAKMHFRLQQGKRAHFSELALDPHGKTFGDVSLILVGDFGQLDPIDDLSMCDTETIRSSLSKSLMHMWPLMHFGKMLVTTFEEAFVLSRIHRSKDDLWWTESCLRLRDFAMTKDGDYDWWLQHDLERGHLDEAQKKYFEDQAVWLCARCQDVGSRNGRKLAHMAEDGKMLVHKITAISSHRSAANQPSSAFDGLRHIIHLVRGCKVMLTRNVAYLYGLANRSLLVSPYVGSGRRSIASK